MWSEVGRRRYFDAAYELVRSHAGTRDGFHRHEWTRLDPDTYVSADGRYRVLARVDGRGRSVRVVQRRVDSGRPIRKNRGVATADEVAQWMAEQVRAHGELRQEDAVYDIEEKFGEEFVYENENGNPAITKEVLRHFTKLTAEDVVWQRGEKTWRPREPGDAKGRQQDD
jgi:hypothetical protein